MLSGSFDQVEAVDHDTLRQGLDVTTKFPDNALGTKVKSMYHQDGKQTYDNDAAEVSLQLVPVCPVIDAK